MVPNLHIKGPKISNFLVVDPSPCLPACLVCLKTNDLLDCQQVLINHMTRKQSKKNGSVISRNPTTKYKLLYT